MIGRGRHKEDWQEQDRGAHQAAVSAAEGVCAKVLPDTVVLSGFAFVEEEMEAERTAACGAPYAQVGRREAIRAGHVASFLALGPPDRGRTSASVGLALLSWWSSNRVLKSPLQPHSFGLVL
jgi:hypothetical protein